jgi:hypothetical protein
MKKLPLFMIMFLILTLTACSAAISATIQSPISTTTTEIAQSTVSLSPTQSTQELSFSRDILPIFQQYSDQHHISGSVLSLETYEGVIQDVVPGQPEQSKLYQRLIGQGGPVMPPGKPLPENLITLIYNWIKQGAKNN